MTVLRKEERQKIIDAVMQRKFGDLLNWKRPDLLHEFGPNDLNEVDFFEGKLAQTVEKVRSEFETWPDNAVQSIADDLDASVKIEPSDWSALATKEIDQLHRLKPPPIAFGFGHPDFATDFAYWGSMPQLSLHEVSTLSLGADPASIKDEVIDKLVKKQENGAKLWSAHVRLLKNREFFSRHFVHTVWGSPPARVQTIKQWVDEASFEVHPLFYERLELRCHQSSPDRTPARKSELGSQERETLLRMIAAMACEQYGYDPNTERSEATARIKDDIEQIGQSMDPKTIRKWLKEASVYVHKDYWLEGK